MPRGKGAKTWLAILLAVIPVLGAVIVGYWQFVYKARTPDQVKTKPYTGRVRDDQSNQPVFKAKVSIEQDQDMPQVQETDAEGIFHVNLPASVQVVRVVVDARGYKSFDRRVVLSRTGIEDIRLQPDLTPQTIATPSPTPTPTPKKPSSGPGEAKSRKRAAGGNCNSRDILLGRC